MSPRLIARTLAALPLVVLLARAAAAQGDTARPDSSSKRAPRFSIGSARTVAGWSSFHFDGLAARLDAAGLPGVASGAATIGMGGDIRIRRLVVGGGWQTMLARQQSSAGYRSRLSGSLALLDLGWVMLDGASTVIYPVGGIGASRVSLHFQERGDFSFDDGLTRPGRGVELTGTALLWHAGLVVERRFRRASRSEFALMARGGLVRSIGTERWSADESTVRGGPGAMRGADFQLAFVKPLARRREAALPLAGTALQLVRR